MTGSHLASSLTIPIKKTQYFTSWSILHWNWPNISDSLYWVKILLSACWTPNAKDRLVTHLNCLFQDFCMALNCFLWHCPDPSPSWVTAFLWMRSSLWTLLLRQCPKLNPKADSQKLKFQAPTNSTGGSLESVFTWSYVFVKVSKVKYFHLKRLLLSLFALTFLLS